MCLGNPASEARRLRELFVRTGPLSTENELIGKNPFPVSLHQPGGRAAAGKGVLDQGAAAGVHAATPGTVNHHFDLAAHSLKVNEQVFSGDFNIVCVHAFVFEEYSALFDPFDGQ